MKKKKKTKANKEKLLLCREFEIRAFVSRPSSVSSIISLAPLFLSVAETESRRHYAARVFNFRAFELRPLG